MKKSFVILIILVQVLALFVFENMYSLFKNLEKNEIAGIIVASETLAELHVARTRLRLPPPSPQDHFDLIQGSNGVEESRQILKDDKTQTLWIKKKIDTQSGLLFKKTIRSPQLDAYRSVKKILSGLTIFLGLFIFACGIYLVVLLRRRSPVKVSEPISPFQDYLIEMKNSQLELISQVAEQSKSSKKTEELNKSIINTIHLAVIFIKADGKIEIFNPAAQKIFKRSFASVKNTTLAAACPEHPELVAFIAATETRNSMEIESANHIFFTEVVPVGSEGRLIVIRDVSGERKREKIQRLNSNLMMLGEMAASLAHEIRNSLGVILGYSKAIRAEPGKTGKISKEIHFLSEMMESFLKFAQPVDKVKYKKIFLGPLIAASAAAQNLAIRLPENDLQLESDPLLLNVVFSNLLRNSGQAGARQVEVEFSAGETPAITIRDDGPGIAAALRDKIWLPFFSTRDKGTGMGLATVKKLVNALNGDIQMVDDGRAGATFRIVFYT